MYQAINANELWIRYQRTVVWLTVQNRLGLFWVCSFHFNNPKHISYAHMYCTNAWLITLYSQWVESPSRGAIITKISLLPYCSLAFWWIKNVFPNIFLFSFILETYVEKFQKYFCLFFQWNLLLKTDSANLQLMTSTQE